jgi:hypothetical protein
MCLQDQVLLLGKKKEKNKMAHFAKLNESNVVTEVIVVHNNELMDNGVESEAKGIAFCKSLFGQDTRWVQTSYNGNFRGKYAGIGYTYDSANNVFVEPQ